MNLMQATLLLDVINTGIDTALKVQAAVNKISAMTDDECARYVVDQNRISNELMKEIDGI